MLIFFLILKLFKFIFFPTKGKNINFFKISKNSALNNPKVSFREFKILLLLKSMK